MSQLPKAYQPQEVEKFWYKAWKDSGCFHAHTQSTKPPFSIVIPPPNVTGILHLGHVLNNTIQDILIRRARQNGCEALWLPGTDHAGIATQTKVEAQLRKEENKTRREIGREAFLQKVWQWKDKHGGIIIDQLKALGCSCDWQRERFTMDEAYSLEVTKVFEKLFKEGFIYRGKRMVNWCPVSLTALSDEEVIMTPQKSKLYYMRYEIAGENTALEISTTRPETLMGDTAVAVHPDDPRYKHLIGKKALRPFPPAEIPIIADAHVDRDFGTGALKITPAHDRADFDIGMRHGLPIIEVIDAQGTINCPECPELHGLDRMIARKKAADILDSMGLLLRVEDYENNVGFSERAHVPIEPRISMQWFLRYPKVKEAKEAVGNHSIRFTPKRWEKTYAHWLDNIQDWCISRQLWWGHRIPVWYKKEHHQRLQEAESLELSDMEKGLIYVGTTPPEDAHNWIQDSDVMDTWFSSWLWPFATMEKEALETFYPTNELVTGPDILFFWVARMIMASLYFQEKIPFKHVFFTSIIRDLQGRKMSKSLGNSPDPVDLIQEYGADALRFGLLRTAPVGSDVRFDTQQVAEGRNFANKLYNACRLRQMVPNAQGSQKDAFNTVNHSIYHLDIAAKLDTLAIDMQEAYSQYRFNELANLLYHFLWSEFCDKFLEVIKEDLRPDSLPEIQQATLATFDAVMARFLALLHPYMPHITEELSSRLGYLPSSTFLMLEPYPSSPLLDSPEMQQKGDEAFHLAQAIYATASQLRNLKANYRLATRKDVRFIFDADNSKNWSAHAHGLGVLAGGVIAFEENASALSNDSTPVSLTTLGEVLMPLDGLIDKNAERKRLEKEHAKVNSEIHKCQAKLSNASFVQKAPESLVAREKERLCQWQEKSASLVEMIANLSA